MCKKHCLNCQFFCVYGFHDIQGRWEITIIQKDRDRIKNEKSFLNIQKLIVNYRSHPRCFKGVWDEERFIKEINAQIELSMFSKEEDEKLKNKLLDTVMEFNRDAKNPRGNSCFYRKFEEGMLLPAAEELEKRETAQKEAAADRKWVKYGVWVAVIIFVIGFLKDLFSTIGH